MKEDLAEKVSDWVVLVLRPGQEEETENGFYAPASISLIQFLACAPGRRGWRQGVFYLVDTGCIGERQELGEVLIDMKVPVEKIEAVFITHNHPDHMGNLELFKKSEIYMPDSRFRIVKPNYFKLMPDHFYKEPGHSIDISHDGTLILTSTPGHAGQDISILYRGRDWVVAVVGDLFWSKEDWEHDSEFMGLCVNQEMQKRSRGYIREQIKPTVVIPGHGPAFQPKY